MHEKNEKISFLANMPLLPLPKGSKNKFQYDVWGEKSRMLMPPGDNESCVFTQID